jgi:hydroxymethylpyrimidine pyrophosphatase-like HAD family hydrolase
MFRIATRALAPANARPELKRIAHEVIGTNSEDSVVRWISGHFMSERAGPRP